MIALLYIILGLVFGSFISAITYRLPKKENFVSDHSKCTKCGHNLSYKDLFPLFSWLYQNGKCRYCGQNVSIRYPLIETVTCVSFFLIYLKGLPITLSIILCFAIILLLTNVVIDWENGILLDSINLILFILACAYAYLSGYDMLYQIINAVLGTFFFWLVGFLTSRILKKDSLGFGDVKLFPSIGMFIKPLLWGRFLIMAGILGMITGLIWKKIKDNEEFPFGPALSLSLFIIILVS